MKLAWVAAVPAIALLWAAPLQAKSRNGETFGDWKIGCIKRDAARPDLCAVFQRLAVKNSGQQLLRVEVAYAGPKGEPQATIILPLGVFLPAGVALKVDDGKQINVPVLYCTAEGCVTRVTLDKPFLEAMLGGTNLRIGVLNVERKEFVMRVSLKGFASGFKALK